MPHGFGVHLAVTATLSRVLHTAELPQPHDAVGYGWWHNRFRLRLIGECNSHRSDFHVANACLSAVDRASAPCPRVADMSRLLPVLADPAGGPPTRGRPGGQRRAAAARGVQRVAPARPLPPAARRSPTATSGSAMAARPGSQAAPLLTQPLSPGRAGSGGETSGAPRAASGGRRRRPQHEA